MNLKDIIATLRDSVTDNKTWQAEKTSVLAKLQEAEIKLSDYAKAEGTNAEVKATYEKQITELKDTHTKGVQALNDQIATLQAKVEAETKSADVKAQAIAASMGIPSEDKLPKVTNTAGSIMDKLEKATSQTERDAIFKSNKSEILSLAGISEAMWNKK
jgi:hypothetical protein